MFPKTIFILFSTVFITEAYIQYHSKVWYLPPYYYDVGHKKPSFLPSDGRVNTHKTTGGYDNFLCGEQNILSCYLDCKINHGTVGGVCGSSPRNKFGYGSDDHNCYCGEKTQVQHPESVHCQLPGHNTTYVCALDCICNHAAKDGHCDYERKACVCEGQGLNPRNSGCNWNSGRDMIAHVAEALGEEALGSVGKRYYCLILQNTQMHHNFALLQKVCSNQ